MPRVALIVGMTLLLCAADAPLRHAVPERDRVAQRLGERVAFPAGAGRCATAGTAAPLLLLVLGQSNAANHGESDAAPETVEVQQGTDCARVGDPLPGATGRGGSVWTRLQPELARLGFTRPIRLSVLAVDATSSGDWTREGSPLPTALAAQARALVQSGMTPRFVLWHQGEADARQGVDAATYQRNLRRLAADLAQAGIDAPVVLARTTVCRSAPSVAIRGAAEALVATDPHFRLGPDTDDLAGPRFRVDGCHLSIAGRQAAAARWAEVLMRLAG